MYYTEELRKRGCKWSSAILYCELDWNSALNWNLIEFARTSVIWIDFIVTSALETIKDVLVVRIRVLEKSNFLFIFLLNSCIVEMTSLCVHACRVHFDSIAVGSFRTFYKLVPSVLTHKGLFTEDTVFVLNRGSFLYVRVKTFRFSAPKHGRLLPLEEDSGFLPSFLFSLCVNKGTLSIVTDVFFYLLFI